MKKYLIFIFALLFVGSQNVMRGQSVDQQNRKNASEEQIRQHQTSQMVHVLMLDDATASKFTPLYTQYLKDMMECHKMKRSHSDKKVSKKEKQELTDAEIEARIKNQFEVSQKMLDIRESYYDKFRKILSPKQILKVYETERHNADKFKKTLKDRKSKANPKQRQSQGN